jgi:hypothetical protein
MFRFLKKPGVQFEAIGAVNFRNMHFYSGSDFNYLVYCEGRRLRIADSYIQVKAGVAYTGGVWFNAGANPRWTEEVTIAPYSTASFASAGYIGILETDVAAIGGPASGYYAVIDGVRYLLEWRSNQMTPGGERFFNFNVYRCMPVYAAQLPMAGPNWMNTPSVLARCAVDQVMVDRTNVTGVAFVGPTITLSSALDSLSFVGGIAELDNITVSGMAMDRLYQQREFGKVRFRDVREQ